MMRYLMYNNHKEKQRNMHLHYIKQIKASLMYTQRAGPGVALPAILLPIPGRLDCM
jgi:hypothetical protein